MDKKLSVILIITLTIIPLAFFGCKSKVEKAGETASMEMLGAAPGEELVTEPAQMVAMETIPATASPEVAVKPAAMAAEGLERNKQIQTALQKSGFYRGSVDGKLGPKSKVAIMDFQKAKGLKVDGKVGPRTWTELEKYLTQ